VIGKFCSGKVVMRAAPSGTGVIAGGAVRAVFDVLGIKDVVVKSLGSNNPHNMIKAAFEGLQKIKTPKMIAEKRGKKVAEITSYIE
jgi:small subunit ribosomal protein S5